MSGKQIGICFLFGAVSAALSTFTFVTFIVPGVIFGFAVGIYMDFYGIQRIHIGKLILWLIVCGFAFYVAVLATIYGPQQVFGPSPIALVLGGFVGSIITVTGFNFLIKNLNVYQILMLVFSGAILSLGFSIGSFIKIPGGSLEIILLFGGWQTGMLLLLAQFVSSSKK